MYVFEKYNTIFPLSGSLLILVINFFSKNEIGTFDSWFYGK